ncbi:hypothetical protein FH063_000944 [Azospirillum argentinense]|uniref:Uncharacterized protein n=1 Tax=Azospirillum argentinense TaxID=2970906 RepID=A0A5B0L5Y5_9PROT|nr:hypothetical protein FH063_000944 [Azospirillum argentinense]
MGRPLLQHTREASGATIPLPAVFVTESPFGPSGKRAIKSRHEKGPPEGGP